MPLVEEILIWAGLDTPANLRLPSEAQVRTTCPTCSEAQTLAEADVAAGDETVYTCKNGCQPILVVAPPGGHPWPGRGYRMGDWTMRNASDVTFQMINQAGSPTGRASAEAGTQALQQGKRLGCGCQ